MQAISGGSVGQISVLFWVFFFKPREKVAERRGGVGGQPRMRLLLRCCGSGADDSALCAQRSGCRGAWLEEKYAIELVVMTSGDGGCEVP